MIPELDVAGKGDVQITYACISAFSHLRVQCASMQVIIGGIAYGMLHYYGCGGGKGMRILAD